MCVCVSVCLSVCLSVGLCVCGCVCMQKLHSRERKGGGGGVESQRGDHLPGKRSPEAKSCWN